MVWITCGLKLCFKRCLDSREQVMYRCIAINYNVVEKFIYFSNSTQIVKLVY